MLNKSHVEQKDENRQVLLKILSSVHYLSSHGIAFRALWKTDDPEILNGESDSNFIQLVLRRAEDSTNLQKWMDNRVFHFYPFVQFRLALYVSWLQHSM